MINADLAFKLIQIANTHPAKSTEEVIERAKAFAAFIENRGGDAVANNELPSEIPGSPPHEPGVRKRRTKAEMAAVATTEAAVNAGLLPAKAMPGEVTYADLAGVMMKLVSTKGRVAGMNVLKQFGLKESDTARALQPEQYAECVELLTAALNADDLA